MRILIRAFSSTTHLILLLALAVSVTPVFSQGVTLPQVSQHASITQTIGITDITIDYHRPGVNDREIWDTQLVPYDGQPSPWRAGANQNTIITFEHDVKIEGQHLAAGTYGFHALPTDGDWTLIFSNNSTSWGSFFYDEAEDALRVTVTPTIAQHQEWLRYGFDDMTATSSTAFLHWEEKRVPFKIEVDTHAIVLENFRNELRSVPGFSWQGWSQAANYCLNNDVNLEEAMSWIDNSIQRDENFTNLRIKSQLVAKAGNQAEADALMKQALESASENELNIYGYQLMGQSKIDEALTVFRNILDSYPESWNAHDSLAEAYGVSGDAEKSRLFYTKALALAPDGQKARIEAAIQAIAK